MKRRRPTTDGHQGPAIPLTPLIDIVFLLLIYFMLASNFVKEQQFHVELPRSHHGEALESAGAIITINRQGEFFLNGDRIPAEDVEARLASLSAQTRIDRVEIRSDRLAPVDLTIKAMDAAKGAGLRRVIISTISEGKGGPRP